ncbi:hypothetical protein LTR85_007585 [Meristemomyces frigidus]|nr:hypothetical protein LTR85_007585 [Meristemomyces frigidus]
MAAFSTRSLLILTLLLSPALACFLGAHGLTRNASESTSNRPSTEKRWYSVHQLDQVQDPAAVKGESYPWPVTCNRRGKDTVTVLKYCFVGQRDADNLNVLLAHAISGYAYAMYVSTLWFQLDDHCKGNPHVYCDSWGIDDDTLRIVDSSTADPSEPETDWVNYYLREGWDLDNGPGDGNSLASAGYDYYSRFKAGRHRLFFGHWNKDMIGNEEARYTATATLMHELGHVIGLLHEHQRPDRDQYLQFNCHNLEGYKEAKEQLMEDVYNIFPKGMTYMERVNALCTTYDAAKAYLPQALDFARDDKMGVYQEQVYSRSYDYDSIMHYPSYMGSIGAETGTYPVLMRKDNGGPLYFGGTPDIAEFELSRGDIARIAQLYRHPSPNAEQQAALGLVKWAPSPMRVKVRDAVVDFETTVFPPRASSTAAAKREL